MIREYRNLRGELLTAGQFLQLDEYTEILIDPATNLVKIENDFKNGIIWSTSYYKDKEESESLLVNSFKTKCDCFNIIERLVVTANYSIESASLYTNYDSFTQPLKSKALLKTNGQLICSQTLEPNTNQPIPKKTEKYYYRNDQNGKEYEVLEGCYKTDGSLKHIIYKPYDGPDAEHIWEYFESTNFNELQSYFTNDISYFLTAELEPGNLFL